MKRIVAMLLAAAAMVCCAGCGASGGAAATTMTEEDFYVYEKGEVVYDAPSGSYHDFTEGQETKRGIRLGSTLEEVVQAYKGESALWQGEVVDQKTNIPVKRTNHDITLGDDTIREDQRGGSLLSITCVKRKNESIRAIGDSHIQKGEMAYTLDFYIEENVVRDMTATATVYIE